MNAYYADAEKTALVLNGVYIPLAVPGDLKSITDGPTLTAVEALLRDGLVIDEFVEPSLPPVASVSARQFKLQLLDAGLLDEVDAWIASQSRAVQIAYEYSGTFVRAEPMMATGFAALGFTDEEVDAFFASAASL